MDEQVNIVFDGGSSTIRTGFAGDESPRVSFPSFVGTSKFSHCKGRYLMTDEFIGSQAQEIRDYLSLRYPIQRGIVTNWEDMEKILDHHYKELNTNPENYPVLFSQPPFNPKSNQEKLAQLMFETFDVPAISVIDADFLCLYTCGRNCGVMINIGDGVSFASPFYESYRMSYGIQRQDFAGRDVTFCLQKLLHEKGNCFTTTSEFETVKDIKEKLSFTAYDFDSEIQNSMNSSNLESSYSLSDGSKISINDERFRCTEALFQPSKFGFQGVLGIHEMVFKSIQCCGLDTHGDVLCNLILSGGSADIPGLRERLLKEMKQIIPERMKMNVVKSVYNDASLAKWIGGSIHASLSGFQPFLISKQRYEEYGPFVMHNFSAIGDGK